MLAHDCIEAREGGLYIASTRVTLASIVYLFLDGASPETIRQNFPSLSLGQVYGAIAFYLNHPREAEAYLQDLKRKWQELEREARPPGENLQKRLDQVRQSRLAPQS